MTGLNKIIQGTPSMIVDHHGQRHGRHGELAGVVFFGSMSSMWAHCCGSANTIDQAAFLTNSNNDFSLTCGNGAVNILPGAVLQATDNMLLVGRTVTNRGTLIAPTMMMAGGVGLGDEITVKTLGDVISLRIKGQDLGLESKGDAETRCYYSPDGGVNTPTNLGSTAVKNTGNHAKRDTAIAAGVCADSPSTTAARSKAMA